MWVLEAIGVVGGVRVFEAATMMTIRCADASIFRMPFWKCNKDRELDSTSSAVVDSVNTTMRLHMWAAKKHLYREQIRELFYLLDSQYLCTLPMRNKK